MAIPSSVKRCLLSGDNLIMSDEIIQSPWEIGIVEDQKDFSQAIADMLMKEGLARSVRTWSSAELYWRDETKQDLDLLYVDHNLPHMSGVELIGMVAESYPEIRIVMLTRILTDNVIFRALQSGAIGYVLKSELKDINEITRQIMEGGAAITPTIALRIFKSFRKSDNPAGPKLTARERQVLEIMVTGSSTEKTAETMNISVATLRVHVKNIYKKLNINNKMDLARKASEMGLL